MAIKFRNNKIGVEKPKQQKTSKAGFYVEPDTEEFLGVIKYLSPDTPKELAIGTKVYFGSECQQVLIKGAQIYVMDEKNVLAIIDETTQETNS